MYIELKTQRLMLRPYGLADFESVHEYASDREIKYMLYLPNATEEDTKNFLKDVEGQWAKEQPDYYEFGAILDGKLIGAVGAYMEENHTKCELGWIFNKNYRGYGYATVAAKAVADFVKANLKVTEIFARCDSRNEQSAKVMQKLGMTKEYEGPRYYERTGEHAREDKYSMQLLNT